MFHGPRFDCPNCGEPGLVNTSTNFKEEWTCNFCEESHDPDTIRRQIFLPYIKVTDTKGL